MWFWFSIIALLCWSGSDLFSKIGCREANDKTAHLKMVMAVGIVMGLHACFEIFVNGVEINMQIIMTYLPVSLLYIISMAMGYIGLRYIELSISSPICNSSGALVAIATIAMSGIGDMNAWQLAAIALVAVGVVALGITEATEDDELRAARQQASNHKYAKSLLALLLPIAYCILDAAGTFADSLVLETLNEDSANADLPRRGSGLRRVCALRQAREADPAHRSAEVYRRGLRDHRPVLLHLCAGGQRARRHERPDHLLLLRRLRALEPRFPQGEAERQALHLHPDGVHRHRHHGRI